MRGSSPHTRGALHPTRRHRPRPRIIPAYAGSTSTPGIGCPPRPDHPRIRGEHHRGIGHGKRPVGSSPHTRGAREKPGGPAFDLGIIPAYAGSTPPHPTAPSSTPDHPRIRGEHFPTPGGTGPCQGSSPHTRGALGRGHRRDERRRIIPAYAGSTRRGGGWDCSRPDHPRIRGEHAGSKASRRVIFGSSPHTRGARAGVGDAGVEMRIIPAYAGSTCSPWRDSNGRGDHPRIRGEHAARRSILRMSPGSSPHTRGAPKFAEATKEYTGIIPAYAGSTPFHPRDGPQQRDHPRIRGEHYVPRRYHLRRKGIIPAYAGSTSIRCRRIRRHRDHPRIRGEHGR